MKIEKDNITRGRKALANTQPCIAIFSINVEMTYQHATARVGAEGLMVIKHAARMTAKARCLSLAATGLLRFEPVNILDVDCGFGMVFVRGWNRFSCFL